MANNRLYLVDRKTGEEILLFKSMGDGWKQYISPDEIKEWLFYRDSKASYGDCGGKSRLFLRTENK